MSGTAAVEDSVGTEPFVESAPIASIHESSAAIDAAVERSVIQGKPLLTFSLLVSEDSGLSSVLQALAQILCPATNVLKSSLTSREKVSKE